MDMAATSGSFWTWEMACHMATSQTVHVSLLEYTLCIFDLRIDPILYTGAVYTVAINNHLKRCFYALYLKQFYSSILTVSLWTLESPVKMRFFSFALNCDMCKCAYGRLVISIIVVWFARNCPEHQFSVFCLNVIFQCRTYMGQ